MNHHTHRKIVIGTTLASFAWVIFVMGAAVQYHFSNVTAATCTPDAKLVNPCRPWSGVWANNYVNPYNWKNSILNYESRVGRQADIIHHYHGGTDTSFSSDELGFINRPNTYLLLNWKPDTNWANAGGGNATVNARIDKKADSIKALGSKKIFLTIFHEPENDISPGTANSKCTNAKGNAGSVAQYRAMWQNVRNRFDAKGVTNVVWTMNYMGYSGWDCAVKDLWPGNGLVDWILWDPYSGDKNPYMMETSRFYNFLTNNTDATHAFTSKPWGLGEFGFNGSDQAKANAYYNDMASSIKNNTLPRLKMYVVFDALGIWDTRVQYTSTGGFDNTEQQRYNAMVNTIFGTTTTPPPTPPTPPTPPAPTVDTTAPTGTVTAPVWNATVKGTVTVNVTAADNVGVAKVQFFIDTNNTTIFAEDTTAPYSAQWNSATTSNGVHTIRAKVFDKAGNSKTPLTQVVVDNSASSSAPQITSFGASPASLSTGGNTTLSWVTQNTASCSVSPSGPQNTTDKSWRTPIFTTAGTITYTLTCKNSAGATVSKTTSVTVTAAPKVPGVPTISADKTTIQKGGNVLISWSSAGATSCRLQPVNVQASGGTGSKLVSNLQATTTFYVTCSNSAGSSRSSDIKVTVSLAPAPVGAPVITSLSASPSKLKLGYRTTITWAATNVVAGGCALTPTPLSSTSASGSWTSYPMLESTTFTLTCKNSAGVKTSKSVDVHVEGWWVLSASSLGATSALPLTVAQANEPILTAPTSNQKVTNAEVSDNVKRGELIALDSANVVVESKTQNITKVEYYEASRLLSTVSRSPYALNTGVLGIGTHSVAERTYYQDGSQSERAQVITVNGTVFQRVSDLILHLWWTIVVGGVLLLLTAVTALLTRERWIPVLRGRSHRFDRFMLQFDPVPALNQDWPFGPSR